MVVADWFRTLLWKGTSGWSAFWVFRWQHRAERLENSFLAAAGQAGKLAG